MPKKPKKRTASHTVGRGTSESTDQSRATSVATGISETTTFVDEKGNATSVGHSHTTSSGTSHGSSKGEPDTSKD
jgi:hypothetical protein